MMEWTAPKCELITWFYEGSFVARLYMDHSIYNEETVKDVRESIIYWACVKDERRES